jgi:hypothetical protein
MGVFIDSSKLGMGVRRQQVQKTGFFMQSENVQGDEDGTLRGSQKKKNSVI